MPLGDRIREERERLGCTQAEFAALGGAAKRSQIGWEQGRTLPNAAVLAAWMAAGADVQYILSGKYSGEVDPALFSFCEAALRKAYLDVRPGAATPKFRYVHICKLYNELVRARQPNTSQLELLAPLAHRYIAEANDPADPGQLERVLLNPPDEPAAPARSHHVSADRGSMAAGRDLSVHEEGAPYRVGKRRGKARQK